MTESKTISVWKHNCDSVKEVNDMVVVEEPLQITLRFGPRDQRTTRKLAMTMRTPGADVLLATGYLFTEQIIQQPFDITHIKSISPNEIVVDLREDLKVSFRNQEREGYVSSSCGICGRTTLGGLKATIPYLLKKDDTQYSYREICGWPARLRKAQNVFQSTGGVHAAALIRNEQMLYIAEDVGRHNALDKLIGHSVRELDLPLDRCGVIMSSRSSFELVQKALMAGIPLLATIGAPSSLAIEIAQENNLTLIGFLKDDHFNVYSGPERIKELSSKTPR